MLVCWKKTLKRCEDSFASFKLLISIIPRNFLDVFVLFKMAFVILPRSTKVSIYDD